LDAHNQDYYSTGAVEMFRIFPYAQTELQLGTAVRMNASFPFVLPAEHLPTNPRRRAVDAGYYDNYGVSVAAAWLFVNRAWVQEHASGVALIQIRAYADAATRRLESPGPLDPPSAGARGLEEISSPLAGVLNAREASSSFRNDQQLALLSRFLSNQRAQQYQDYMRDPANRSKLMGHSKTGQNLLIADPSQFFGTALRSNDDLQQEIQTASNDFFRAFVFEYAGNASLSWYLTEAEKRQIHKAADEIQQNAQGANHQELQKLLKWWEQRPHELLNQAKPTAPPPAQAKTIK
jgi:hypothetical protein